MRRNQILKARFFFCLYVHVGRGIYYGSYNYKSVWVVGVLILLIFIATAFLGYVLPWGQISFWGATVITNLFSAIPYLGTEIVYWLWGGFAVDNATLTRFFALHFLLPFIIRGLSIVHLLFLHITGSSNPLGVNRNLDKTPFHPYFPIKDLVGTLIFQQLHCLFTQDSHLIERLWIIFPSLFLIKIAMTSLYSLCNRWPGRLFS